MALDANGEWDGVCACGKKEADGIKCFLGATHKPYNPQPMPWATRAEMVMPRVATSEASVFSVGETQIKSTAMQIPNAATVQTVNDTPWTPPWQKNEKEDDTKKTS